MTLGEGHLPGAVPRGQRGQLGLWRLLGAWCGGVSVTLPSPPGLSPVAPQICAFLGCLAREGRALNLAELLFWADGRRQVTPPAFHLAGPEPPAVPLTGGGTVAVTKDRAAGLLR